MRIKFRNGRVLDTGNNLEDTVEGLAKYAGTTQEAMLDRIKEWEFGELKIFGLIAEHSDNEGTVWERGDYWL
jgi:hypothetical protein